MLPDGDCYRFKLIGTGEQRGRFHVDYLSSAHVYLRLPVGRSIDDIPADTLEDCAQLVKANSIQGNKAASVDVVYTPWANLRKTASMEVGQACQPVNAILKLPTSVFAICATELASRPLHGYGNSMCQSFSQAVHATCNRPGCGFAYGL